VDLKNKTNNEGSGLGKSDKNDKSGYGINEIADNMSKELNLNS